MGEFPIQYIELSVRPEWKHYCIYKVYHDGRKILWTTEPIKRSAIRKAKEIAKKLNTTIVVNQLKKRRRK